MGKRTLTVCLDCGRQFFGNADKQRCPECTELRRKNVVRERICQDCGKNFMGGPRARRCPACREIAKKETWKRYHRNGARRTLGSIDKCARCGKEYVVKSGRQKYCPECAAQAVIELQREYKTDYNRASGFYASRAERHSNFKKICSYCGRLFETDSSSPVCSDYCREQQKKLRQAKADLKRGRRKSIDNLLEQQRLYREQVKVAAKK